MCRFISYIGAPIIPSNLLHEPANSLINQSTSAREREEPLNGDGFGFGWYVKSISPEPALFRSVQPAWSDQNLRSIAEKTLTNCFFAHVRAATHGETNSFNCHPFRYKNFLMMHNGEVKDFTKIKRKLLNSLSDEHYNWLKGETDSVHVFALFLTYLGNSEEVEDALGALEKAIAEIKKLKDEAGVNSETTLNLVITNGDWTLATRYASNSKAHTLYFSSARQFSCDDGNFAVKPSGRVGPAVLIVSEKLTDEPNDWTVVPENHAVIISSELEIELRKIRE